MKYLIILLLFPCVCCGQKKDSLKSVWTDAVSIEYRVQGGDTTWFYPDGSQKSKIREMIISPKQDTIPVRIQYSYLDSVKAPGLKYLMYENDTLVPKETDEGYIFDNRVYWQYGYEVSGYEEGILPNGAAIITWPDKKYLDKDKNPLSKNIIVWLTKEIKQ